VGIETIIGDPFDGRLENGCVYGCGSVDTKASLGLVLALLDHMQHWGEDLKPNLVVCAVEEIGCSGAPLFARGRGLNLSQLVVADPAMCAPIYTIKARRPSSAPANRNCPRRRQGIATIFLIPAVITPHRPCRIPRELAWAARHSIESGQPKEQGCVGAS
jgi:hypothetical protein